MRYCATPMVNPAGIDRSGMVNGHQARRGALSLRRRGRPQEESAWSLATRRRRLRRAATPRVTINQSMAPICQDDTWQTGRANSGAEGDRLRVQRDLVVAVAVPGQGGTVLLERAAVYLDAQVLTRWKMVGQSPGPDFVGTGRGRGQRAEHLFGAPVGGDFDYRVRPNVRGRLCRLQRVFLELRVLDRLICAVGFVRAIRLLGETVH